jgi:thiamine-monophosphate kinase
VGDDVFVTGVLGGAASGLWSMQREIGVRTADGAPQLDPLCDARARERYLRPTPRVRAGMALAGHKAASACIDLSDGLADGVRRIAEASNVGITIFDDAVPLDEAACAWHGGDRTGALDTALRAGDDYELLFTCPPRARGRLRGVRRLVGDLPITRIGAVTKGREICVRTSSGDRALPDGFAHFG